MHKRQWERYGFLMPVLYLLAGRDPLRNRFEIEAGLEDGNYVPAAGGVEGAITLPRGVSGAVARAKHLASSEITTASAKTIQNRFGSTGRIGRRAPATGAPASLLSGRS